VRFSSKALRVFPSGFTARTQRKILSWSGFAAGNWAVFGFRRAAGGEV